MVSKEVLKTGAQYALGAASRVRAVIDREPRFAGAYPTLELAQASLSEHDKSGYDCDKMPAVSMKAMLGMQNWDYSVVYWINRIMQQHEHLSLLDAGGHIGTKHHAFGAYLDQSRIDWKVWDLPALLRAGRAAQNDGIVSKNIDFVDTPSCAGHVDLLLASGLLQYLDISFTELLDRMATRPRWVILNKVATRPNDDLVTLELIGSKRVPYQMRHRDKFENELRAAGYEIRDDWSIPGLSHRVETHPWLGESESKGYVLELIARS